MLIGALKASRPKILIFLLVIITITVISGTLLYMVEDYETGFTSIPRSVYWAIVTITTVGYGDIYPQTIIGQTLASVIMILGYAIIAVPTGIFGAELIQQNSPSKKQVQCRGCGKSTHLLDSKFCDHCGSELPVTELKI